MKSWVLKPEIQLATMGEQGFSCTDPLRRRKEGQACCANKVGEPKKRKSRLVESADGPGPKHME